MSVGTNIPISRSTQAEVNTGSDSEKVITPSTLTGTKNIAGGIAGLDSSGKIDSSVLNLATSAEIITGTNAQKVISPSALAASKNVAGGIAGLDSNARIPIANLPIIITTTVPTVTSLAEGQVAFVLES